MDLRNIDEGHADGEEPLVFHYNREERIKNAPELVQKYYSGDMRAFKPGLFRALVSTRANRFMFFCLVLCVIVVAFVGFFGPSKSSSVMSGVDFKLSAFSYEDTVYCSLKLGKPGKKYMELYAEALPVTVDFKAMDADNQVLFSDKQVLKYMAEELFIRTTFTDYDIFNVVADVNFNGQEISYTCPVEKH